MPMTDDGRRPTLCIGVLTLNEERRIEGCLRSAAFADQIVVVDSGSTDRTRDIAQSMGAEVYVYDQWEGFATQRNRLLAHVKTDYIFFLDADEEITPALQAEIEAAIKFPMPKVWETYWQEVAFGKPIFNLMGKKSLARLFPKCRIPDDHIIPSRRGYLLARSILQELLRGAGVGGEVSSEGVRS